MKAATWAVEAAGRSVKHPFPVGKLPVRGQFQVVCTIITFAAIAKVRRIQRYLPAKIKAGQAAKSTQGEPGYLPEATVVSFFLPLLGYP